jgi:hypothetical protein
VEAYEIGVRDDRYANGYLADVFVRMEGQEHQHEFGMALATERLVSIVTGRRWLNQPGKGGDVEGLNVRWTHHDHGGLPIRTEDVDDGCPWVLGTGNTLESLVIRGWLHYGEVCLPEHWRSDWQHPAWCAPQRIGLRPLSTLPPLRKDDPWLIET